MPCHLIRSLFESIILLIRVYAPLCTFNKISELMNPAAPFKGRKPIFEERTRTGCFKELSAKTPKAQKGKSWASSSAEERWEGAIVIFSQDQGRLADFSFFATLQARAFPFSFIFRAGNIYPVPEESANARHSTLRIMWLSLHYIKPTLSPNHFPNRCGFKQYCVILITRHYIVFQNETYHLSKEIMRYT